MVQVFVNTTKSLLIFTDFDNDDLKIMDKKNLRGVWVDITAGAKILLENQKKELINKGDVQTTVKISRDIIVGGPRHTLPLEDFP